MSRAEGTQFVFDSNYPYLRRMKELSLKPSFGLWIALRAFSEIYFPLGLKPCQTILDVGCCTGNLGEALKLGGVHTVGIDINMAALTAGQSLFGPNSQTQAEACMLPFADGAFSSVVSSDLLEHLPSPAYAEKALWEMARVNGGRFMLHKITVLEDREWINDDDSHRIKWKAQAWKSWFAKRGWQTIAPTTRHFPVWNRKKIGFGVMHGYFLLSRR